MTNTNSAYDDWRIRIKDIVFGVACFALLIGPEILLASRDADPIFGRTVRTVHATIVLMTAAVCCYVLQYRGALYKHMWRSLWTAAYLAFLVHLWCAFSGTFAGD